MSAMSRITSDVSYSLTNYDIIRNREIGSKTKVGYEDELSRKIYHNMAVCGCDSEKESTDQGGIFNLEFSLDGKLLVAACEEKSVLLYDASNQSFIRKINNAHKRCVNCVRFLDNNTFATCSDDGTIKLWDIRHLKVASRTLEGHSNWVKNIEYSEKEKVMVTSAFDGSIYAWDLQSYTENSVLYNKVFVMTGLMRTKLTPDGSKMIIGTTNGYMIIVHDLNLSTMSNDMKTFRPDLYRLMQVSEQTFPAGTMFNYLFATSRNRLEFIDDFPNEAEVISSVQIHPMGWCALTRNVSAEDREEWTCVHDIQMRDQQDYDEAYSYIECEGPEIEEIPEEEPTTRLTDIWMGFTTNEQTEMLRRQNRTNLESGRAFMGVINSGLIGHNYYTRHFEHRPEDKYRIVKNLPRLTHSIKELAVGQGYIKELCFSTDGRIICSPYDRGIRLLAFNEQCQEICCCVPDKPRELYMLANMKDYHDSLVVCCKFSPTHYQVVSGCLGGDIVWYNPLL
ncbi:WD40 domain-containing protein [Oryctes borbonicus]|uniref:WD40 domain-containing protein n=1 Tax=Oryctes borbonicus TaxID=1629725 RepID=A0A0T6BHL4_9SCAR|nr:WD40 domain-containing protein [Oryctes borbonicus]